MTQVYTKPAPKQKKGYDSFTVTTDKLGSLNSILKLDTPDDVKEYTDMFLEPQKLVYHFNVCTYLLKETDSEKMLDKLKNLDIFPSRRSKAT